MAERGAQVDDVHDTAFAMPHVVRTGDVDFPVHQVGGRPFVCFRTPRADAVDPTTGERLADVVVIWIADDGDKQALVDDAGSPFFTTAHVDGHPSVLVRAPRLEEVAHSELVELVQEAWLSRTSARRARAWRQEQRSPG